MSGTFSYFNSLQRIDSDGEAVDFGDGENFQSINFDLKGSYGLTNNLELSLGIGFTRNQSTLNYEEEQYELSSNGLRSGLVQLRYSFAVQDGFQLALEGNYEPAFFTNSEYDGGEPSNLVLGDDGASTSFGASFSLISQKNNYVSGKVLYRNPSSNLSSEVYSEVEGVMAWRKFALLAGAEFVSSLNQDAYEEDPENKPLINGGSSFLYNSVNRSWTAPYLGMNFALGKLWRLETRYQSRLSGVSTDLGSAFLIKLARRDDNPKTFAKKNSAFKQYTAEGSVTKVSKSGKAVVVDLGMSDGLKKGSRIDFYHFDYLEGNELIATGQIVKLGAGKSLVKITGRYAKKRVEEGTSAKGGLLKSSF